jgi:hypothetical protein
MINPAPIADRRSRGLNWFQIAWSCGTGRPPFFRRGFRRIASPGVG